MFTSHIYKENFYILKFRQNLFVLKGFAEDLIPLKVFSPPPPPPSSTLDLATVVN